MKKARIIYNPTAGREQFVRHIPETLLKLEQAGYETSCHQTIGDGDAEREARRAVERGFDVVVAAGGDGTLNEVINGLADAEVRPKLGVIPAGTTNDFARALKLPRSIDEAVDVITAGKSMKVDIGKMNSRYFINIAGGGRLTELTYNVPIKLKTRLGHLAYYLKGIEMLPSLKDTNVTTIEYDGKVFEGEIMFFLVANTTSVGGFEKLAPDGDVQDGKFRLIALKKTPPNEFIRLLTLAARGEHIHDPNVIYESAQTIKVTSREQMLINLDGEFGGEAPVEFVNLNRHIEVFVP